MSDFLQTVKDRVVIYDGAMGTNIQFRNPSVDDFWGKEGCNELLVLSRPDIIKNIHADFFKVGCDVVETNTFGGARVVLAEYDLQDKVAEINITAAKIAKEVAQQFSTKDKPRFVAGSIGPTTKLPSLGHITFDNMVAGYTEQASALSKAASISYSPKPVRTCFRPKPCWSVSSMRCRKQASACR
jgi:5-methyltetrahydrofolate--homocysteine methyltransferase